MVVVGKARVVGNVVREVVVRIVPMASELVLGSLKAGLAGREAHSRVMGLGSRGFWCMPKKST